MSSSTSSSSSSRIIMTSSQEPASASAPAPPPPGYYSNHDAAVGTAKSHTASSAGISSPPLVAFSAETPFATYIVFGVGIIAGFSLLLAINTMSCREFFKMQFQTHLWGGILGTFAFLGAMRIGFEPAAGMTASYLIFTIPMMHFWGFPRRQMLMSTEDGSKVEDKGGVAADSTKSRTSSLSTSRRTTRQYYNSVIAGFIEHLLYFIVFLGRQNGTQYSDMRRALEQEFTVLMTAWVLPVLPTISVDTMLNSYVTQQSAAIDFLADLCKRPRAFGEEFQMYQLFEGINHFAVVLGGLVILLLGRNRDIVFGLAPSNKENTSGWGVKRFFCGGAAVVLYEYGILCELLLYGPQYFWMLTINLFNAIFDSPYEVSSVEYKALVAVSSAIVFVHHTGYWIDTWATMEVLRSWGFSSFTNCDELFLSTNNKTSVVERKAVGAAGARPSDLQTKLTRAIQLLPPPLKTKGENHFASEAAAKQKSFADEEVDDIIADEKAQK